MHHSSRKGQGFLIDPWIKTLAIPAMFCGLDYNVTTVNGAAARLMGWNDSAPRRSTLLRSLVSKDDAARFFSDLIALQNDDGSLRDTQVQLRREEKEAVGFKVSPLRDEQNQVLGFVFQHVPNFSAAPAPSAAMQDTLRKASADATLAENEWRLKLAVHSAKQGIWDHDFENNRHFVSQGWREMRGLAADAPFAAETDDWLETIHPSDLDHIKEELHKLNTGETDTINYQFRQRHAAGHWVWFLSKGRVIRRDRDGLPARILGTDTDITELKKAEMESKRMAHRLNAAVLASGVGRWEYDVEAAYAFWDDRVLEIAGLTDGQHIRSPDAFLTIVHPDEREEVDALCQKCLEEEKDIAFDFRVLRPDGTIRHVRSRGLYAKDEETGPRYYGVHLDITEDRERARALEAARAQLEHESRHDALTGLANRRYLDTYFVELSKDPDATAQRVAVMHFDIDNFKQINDTLGHDAGDALLKHASGVLVANLPDNALVSRVGGDEFVALLKIAPQTQVLNRLAKEIITEMAKPFFYNSQLCNIGTSIGIAVSEGGEPLESGLFISADLALYEAKKAGRARARFFNDEMKKEAQRRKNSFDALLEGFDQGEITCHYQPQFDTQSLALTGVEALVRWESAKFGLMMPDEFLDTAADMGLMPEFDELVLTQALEDLERWDSAGLHVPRITVNVSSHRLNDPSLGQRLSKLDLPHGRLSFELLESAFLDSRNDVIDANLATLADLGIEIEIDDFGSGHASIVSLLQIAPKRLKVDRLLVGPVVESRRQCDLVARIVDIGKMLDIDVIAEGVETAEHVRIMQQIGCGGLQGYGLARPMDRTGLKDFLIQLSENGGQLSWPEINQQRVSPAGK